jgi:malate dehydrogenase (oxaloacetate-decarboxylating)
MPDNTQPTPQPMLQETLEQAAQKAARFLRPSPSYSMTLRAEHTNQVGMMGRITSVIGEAGGDVGAIDIVSGTRATTTRDITFSAADYEHGQAIISAVRAIEGVDIVQVSDRVFLMHIGGKLEVVSKVPIKTRDDLSMAYTPGVARIAQAIAEDPADLYNLTIKKNSVAVISDGSALLGLGNIGPGPAMPVMESKALLFKEFAGINAFPLCLDVKSDEEFVAAVKAIAPNFGAIHLEDIAPPRCFNIEAQLEAELSIPVMHNDQHGTAIVVLAALINALKIVGKQPAVLKVVIHKAEAAGVATARLLRHYGVRDIVICDTGHGIWDSSHPDFATLAPAAAEAVKASNPRGLQGDVRVALKDADVFLGFGGKHLLSPRDIADMASDSIVFEMAYPTPEIEPDSISGLARIIATGRSDFPNQINNMLCFPGFFRGLLDCRATGINDEMRLAAAHAIADVVGREEINEDYLTPSVFDRRVARAVASAVIESATRTGLAGRVLKTAR